MTLLERLGGPDTIRAGIAAEFRALNRTPHPLPARTLRGAGPDRPAGGTGAGPGPGRARQRDGRRAGRARPHGGPPADSAGTPGHGMRRSPGQRLRPAGRAGDGGGGGRFSPLRRPLIPGRGQQSGQRRRAVAAGPRPVPRPSAPAVYGSGGGRSGRGQAGGPLLAGGGGLFAQYRRISPGPGHRGFGRRPAGDLPAPPGGPPRPGGGRLARRPFGRGGRAFGRRHPPGTGQCAAARCAWPWSGGSMPSARSLQTTRRPWLSSARWA